MKYWKGRSKIGFKGNLTLNWLSNNYHFGSQVDFHPQKLKLFLIVYWDSFIRAKSTRRTHVHRYNGALLSKKIEIENFTEAYLKVSESNKHTVPQCPRRDLNKKS